MKKIISIFLAALLIAGALSAISFAEDTKTYTQAFIEDVTDGFSVEVGGPINGKIAVKGQDAAFELPILGLKAKAIMKDGKTTAYISPFFKADVTELISSLIGDINIGEIVGSFEIPEEINQIFEYTKVSVEKNGDTITETFTPDAEKFIDELKAAVAGKIEDPELKETVLAYSAEDFINFVKALPDGEDNGKAEYENLMKCGAKVIFKDGGKTVTYFEFTVPSEDFKTVNTFGMEEIELSGFEIKSVSVNVDDSLFKATGIFNITWLVKLLAKYILNSLG